MLPSRVVTAGGWTFLTNHGHVLLEVARDPDIRVKELAEIATILDAVPQVLRLVEKDLLLRIHCENNTENLVPLLPRVAVRSLRDIDA